MTNMTDLWATTTEQLKISLPQHAYNTWLEPIRPESINGNTIILNVPNQFFYEWIESHYATTIRKTVKSISNDTDVKFVVSHQKNRRNRKHSTPAH